MTRPPEYRQVAQWLRAINGDAGFLEEIMSGYYDLKYADDNGLTLKKYVEEQQRFLADTARRELGGIDLEGTSLDQVAQAYHDKQIAQFAARQRVLLERIRALESGEFQAPPQCAKEAARSGISLAQAIEDFRQDELQAARDELDALDDQYAVGEDEVQAYWAATGAARPDRAGPGTGSPGAGSSREGQPPHDPAPRRRSSAAADLAALDFPASAPIHGLDAPSEPRRAFSAGRFNPASWIRHSRVSP